MKKVLFIKATTCKYLDEDILKIYNSIKQITANKVFEFHFSKDNYLVELVLNMLKKKNIKYINFNENNDINEVLNYANKNNIKYFFLFGIGHNSVLEYKMGAFLNNIKLYAF